MSQFFVNAFNALKKPVFQNCLAKNMWPGPQSDKTIFFSDKGIILDKLIGIVDELNAAQAAVHVGNPPNDKCPGFSDLEVELADAVIRILDLAGGANLRVAEALIAKHTFNSITRPRR